MRTIWGWLVACGHGAVPAAPPAAVVRGPDLVGLCDASAAVVVDGRFVVVADDEHNDLRVFTTAWAPAGTVHLAALSPLFDGAEADLEGMATAPDGAVWIVGSHDPGKGTDPKPERQRLFALRFAATDQGLTASLVGTVDTSAPMLAPVSGGTEGRTAKDPLGLSIEGLAWRDGALEFGFRAPVRAGVASIVRLAPGGAPELRTVALGGRGIRSMETDGPDLLVIAGGDPGFALFRLPGGTGAPIRADLDFGDLTPEALVRLPDGWWVLSDDGRKDFGGEECRKLPESARRARTARITIP